MTAKPSLILFRPTLYRDSARDYRIHINDAEAGFISQGRHKEFTLEPGKHQLRLSIDWGGSPSVEFVAKEGETVFFTVHNALGANPFSNLWTIFFAANRYLALSELAKEEAPQGQSIACERCGDFVSTFLGTKAALCEPCFIRSQSDPLQSKSPNVLIMLALSVLIAMGCFLGIILA